MGLGLSASARLQPWLNKYPGLTGDRVIAGICGALSDLISDPLARQLILCEATEDGGSLQLHPSSEPLLLSIEKPGVLKIAAKTSTAGPGYHAFLVELLEKFEGESPIRWNWNDEANLEGDETDYRRTRDYTALQRAMLQWLKGLARSVSEIGEDPDVKNLALSMPLGHDVQSKHFAITPLGPRSREWFFYLSRSDGEGLEAFGEDFFSWWEREPNAKFWLKTGQVIAWVDLPWHAPENRRENDAYRLALACFERARELDPEIDLPTSEMEEIETLLRACDPESPPSPAGMGYRRLTMRRPLTGDWTIDLPGYYYSASDDDGETVTYSFGHCQIRGSSFDYDVQNGADKLGPLNRLFDDLE